MLTSMSVAFVSLNADDRKKKFDSLCFSLEPSVSEHDSLRMFVENALNRILKTNVAPFRVVTVPAILSLMVLLSGGACSAAPIVHPGDTLNVNVQNYAALIDDSQQRLKDLQAADLIVAADGSISLPIAGTIRVAGKSVRQVQDSIEQRLSRYVREPAVSVTLVQQAQLIFLTGATVGTQPFLPGETLSTALGQMREQFRKDSGSANGVVKDESSLARTAIDFRAVSLQRDQHKFPAIDGEALLRDGKPGPALQPGDTVLFVNKPVRVVVRGQVSEPGPIYLYNEDTLEEAVLAAGGPLSSASSVDASLVRDGTDTPLPLGSAQIRQHPRDGDTIIVRAAPHVTVLGQVPTPGEFTLKNGSSLLIALYVAGGPTKWANVRDIQVIHEGVHTSYDLNGLQHGDLSQNVPLVDGDQVYVPEGHKIDARLFFQGLLGAVGTAYDVSHP